MIDIFTDFCTTVQTKNSEVVMFHNCPFTEEEITNFKLFTTEEIIMVLKERGFSDHQI